MDMNVDLGQLECQISIHKTPVRTLANFIVEHIKETKLSPYAVTLWKLRKRKHYQK
jgi:hypothetical protein